MRSTETHPDGVVPDGALWREWLFLVSSGGLVGFCVPTIAGVLTAREPTSVQLASLMTAGLVEGAVLGFAQAQVLTRVLPGFDTPGWVRATASGVSLAWFLGMVPSSTHSIWSTWPPVGVAVAAVALGVALLVSIGWFQARTVAVTVDHRYRWLMWTALGWVAGLAAFSAVAPPLWHDGHSIPQLVIIGVLGGSVMACAMAAVTGIGALKVFVHTPRTGTRDQS